MKISKNDSLKKRLISMLLLAPPILWVIQSGGIWFVGLAGLVAAILIWEWEGFWRTPFWGRGLFAALGASPIMAMIISETLAILLMLIVLIALIMWPSALRPCARRWRMLSLAWTLVPIFAFLLLRSIPDYGCLFAFWVVLGAWSADIAAYSFGRVIGGPKLAPKVSASKTWSGAMGGVLAGPVISLLVVFSGKLLAPQVPSMSFAVSLGLLISVATIGGDLAQSALKRHFCVKDSGHLIPGHGGLFDRCDGLLAALIPATLVLWTGYGQSLSW